jgi:CRISPR-associated protein Csc3
LSYESFIDGLLFSFRNSELNERQAKLHDFNPERELIDQGMREHIESGINALKSIINFLKINNIPVDEEEIKQASVAYMLHDLHKVEEKAGTSEYSQELDHFTRWQEQLTNGTWSAPSHFLRLAGVSRFSNKYGDFSHLPSGTKWSYILKLVKLMDKAASITSVHQLIRKNGIRSLRQAIVQLLPPSLQSCLRVEVHFLQEMRGILSTQFHNTIARKMKETGYYPWLYFADGTVYLAIENERLSPLPGKQAFIEQLIAEQYELLMEQQDFIDMEDLFDRSTLQFQTYAFLFLQDTHTLLDTLRKILQKPSQASKKFPLDKFSQAQLKEYGCTTVEQLFEKMVGQAPDLQEDMQEKWFYVARFLYAFMNVLKHFGMTQKGDERSIQLDVAEKIGCLRMKEMLPLIPKKILSNNRRFDDAIWMAYDYLQNVNINGRTALEIEAGDLYAYLNKVLQEAFKGTLQPSIAREYVENELKIEEDLQNYLQEQLYVSWEKTRAISLLDNEELVKKKTRSQKKICNICNRQIVKGAAPKIKAPILEDDIQVFSNRLLPKEKDVSALHWCSVCHFEFILQKTFGLKKQGERGLSHRIYLYAFPTFQFTEEVRESFEEELSYHYKKISVRSSNASHAWQTPFLVENWQLQQVVDHLQEHFRFYQEKISKQIEKNGRLHGTDDLLLTAPHSNYFLYTYDCYSSTEGRTREETWMKALTVALTLHLMYGFRVYLTEKPFLSISNVDELCYAIHLDSPPLRIKKLFAPKESAVGCAIAIDHSSTGVRAQIQQLAYLWEMHQHIHPLKPKKPGTDKEISNLLHIVEVHPLAGAYVYKRYCTEHGWIDTSFEKACQLWWQKKKKETEGGEGWMNLAERIAEASCALYRPNTSKDGRAHRYENLFRTIVKGIMRGAGKDELAGLVMKRLERLVNSGQGYVFLPIKHEHVEHLVDLVYGEFYEKMCQKSLFKLNQRQNQLADGIYFVTHKLLSRKKEEENGNGVE